MSLYFIDTEFIEGPQYKTFCGIKYGKTKPTIDLISIGIVSEDVAIPRKSMEQDDKYWKPREYYAISKDFNLKEAWNRFDEKVEIMSGDMRNRYPEGRKYKEYWIRENVLKPIFDELIEKENIISLGTATYDFPFTYNSLKRLINKYGKTNKQIAEEVKEFITKNTHVDCTNNKLRMDTTHDYVEFYGYYCDYDWVGFCWLFGKMINLPNGFPMYCRDLKQTLDEKAPNGKYMVNSTSGFPIKEHQQYPKQSNEHNALADALFNKKLYYFLQNL